ncbi:MAG TPA: hypothetical protein PLD23_03190 [Armatimonadota bacterium]|nr:hypothetical protein [Armatimonadota bacterium]HQK92479.1 hypothetical protein [Armatimonadota bacterium]
MALPGVVIHITDELQPEISIQRAVEGLGLSYLAFYGIRDALRAVAHTHDEGRLVALVTDLSLRPPGHLHGRDEMVGVDLVRWLKGSDRVRTRFYDCLLYDLIQALASSTAASAERENARHAWLDFSRLLLSCEQRRSSGDGTAPVLDAPIVVFSEHANDPRVVEDLSGIGGVVLVPKSEGPEAVARVLRALPGTATAPRE